MEKLTWSLLNNFEIENILKNIKPEKYNIIGQQKAIETLKFGLLMESKNYNIYVCGESSSGKKTAALKYAKEIAKEKKAPPDLCYVYNFENPKVPKLLKLQNGLANMLKKDMKEIIEELLEVLTEVMKSDEYETSKTKIIRNFEDKKDLLMQFISEKSKVKDFEVKQSGTGIYFLPILEGKTLTEEEFSSLPEEEQIKIIEDTKNLKKSFAPVLRKMRDYDLEVRKSIADLEYEKLLFEVGNSFGELFIKYESHEEIIKYLKATKEDVLLNIELFLEEVESPSEEEVLLMPWMTKKDSENSLSKYKVNVLVDNSSLKSAPVIFKENAGYRDIVGEVEYDTENGNYITDFTKIRAGELHKANGGYLILYISDMNYLAIDALFTSLKKGNVEIEPIREFQTMALNLISPEPLDLDVKIILLGDYFAYDALSFYDDFKKLFKIKVEFDYEMELKKEENIAHLLSLIDEKSRLTKDAKVVLFKFLIKMAGHKNKITTNIDLVIETLEEASLHAKIDKKEVIDKQIIEKTIKARNLRNNLYEEKLTKMIEEGKLLIDVKGSRIGQINALSVIEMDEYSFGKPSKITATCFAGTSGIINIEKESRMSGKIHDKGVHILAGYLGSTYAKEEPISVSIRIAFEQNYSGIDGDSASSTEAYAIISAISGIPISSEIAVTGSMNQFGDVQPIGGVTEKIEGFFDTCKQFGLTGNQGVIIPHTNIDELMLNDEVIEAVKDDKFHIYAISHIEEGLEILMNVPIAEIHAKTKEELKKYSDKAKDNEKTKDNKK